MRARGWTQPQALRVGERVRYLDGSLWRVERESAGGAHLRCYKGSGREVEQEVEFTTTKRRGRVVVLDEPRRATFKTTTGKNHAGDLDWVSSYSLLERVEEEGDVTTTTTKTDGAASLGPTPEQVTADEPLQTIAQARVAARGARMADKDAFKAKARAPKGKPPLNTAAVKEKVAAVAAPVANVLETIARAVTKTVAKKTSATVKQDKPAAESSAAKEPTMKTNATKKTAKADVKKRTASKAPAHRAPKAKASKGDRSRKPYVVKSGGEAKYRDLNVPVPCVQLRWDKKPLSAAKVSEMKALRRKDEQAYSFQRLGLIFGTSYGAAKKLVTGK